MSSAGEDLGGSVVPFNAENRNRRFSLLYQEHLSIEAADAWRVGEVGYICRALVQATLPYKEPKGSPPAWGRTNGKISLVIQPGYYMKQEVVQTGNSRRTIQTPVSLGYPYGSIPRLLLAWMGKEVKIHKNRELILGRSLVSFMAELGMDNPTGGRNGSITRLREQMRRLFAAKIAILDNPDPSNSHEKEQSFLLAEDKDFWWDNKDAPNQQNLFESKILLSERFFNELVSSPVPVDMRALRALKGSPSALDLYCFLTYRMFTLQREIVIPWDSLMLQFGSEANSERKFRWQFKQALTAVKVVYPAARVDVDKAGLIMKPSRTSVMRANSA